MAYVWVSCFAFLWSQASGQGLADFFKSLEATRNGSSAKTENFQAHFSASVEVGGSPPVVNGAFDFGSFFGWPAESSVEVYSESSSEIAGSIEISRPILVNIGPFVDIDFGRDGEPDPFEAFFASEPRSVDFDASMEQDFQSIFNLLEAQAAGNAQSGGFQVDTQDGWFQMRALLPGYKMQPPGKTEEKQPLTVQVLGQSLMVQGQQTEGNLMRSFQRSFRLPSVVDCGGITVTYNVKDGALAVDIPAKEGSLTAVEGQDEGSTAYSSNDGTEMWAMNTLEGGSQTSIMFSSGCHHGASEAAEERRPSASRNGEARRPPRKPTMFLESAPPTPANEAPDDPLAELLDLMFGATPKSASAQKPVAPVAKDRQAASQIAAKSPPVVVQSKDAKPFWRLVTDEAGNVQNIEVVLPDGIEVGTPEGESVPVYRSLKAQDAAVPMRNLIGRVELPVSVHEKDCAIIEKSDSITERMLSCTIAGEVVKRVPIRVIDDEL